MSPQCCRCNGNGRCKGCLCARSRRICTNTPSHNGRCENLSRATASEVATQPPDAAGWRRICTGFHGASNDLCRAIAALSRRICTTFTDPMGLAALTACRLIPLSKDPGVRPIGICETIRRIIGKAVLKVTKSDIQLAVGSLQLCAGHKAGCEAAIHAMHQIFEDEETEGVLLVDAKNAFNSLNHAAALHNSQILCPSLAPILINIYIPRQCRTIRCWRIHPLSGGNNSR